MRHRAPLLFVTVLVIATAGLVYELIAGTLASYVLGDSVRQFSTVIGTYMSAMGLGAYVSKYVKTRVAERFVQVELAAAFVGGGSAPFLFIAFGHADSFSVLLYGTVVGIGTLVGLELPLLMRILREELEFSELIAKVLTLDYAGALVGSLAFAILLVPGLGLLRTSLFFGLLNGAVALLSTWVLADRIYTRHRTKLRVQGVLLMGLLTAGFVFSEHLTRFAEEGMYQQTIVHASQTPYQRIVLTRGRGAYQLFLNGNLQFNTSDEYRYHEALVHPAFAAASAHRRVLVLGGGDGLAVREILRYPAVEKVTVVDLDPGVVSLARKTPVLRELNGDAYADPRVEVVHDDAMVWLDETRPAPYDVIIVDFPDPNNFSLGKLYTSWFYTLMQGAMHSETIAAVQSTSPLYARKSYWCIVDTMAAAGLSTQAYHALVPSFGEWGYVLAKKTPFEAPTRLQVSGLKYLNDATLPTLFVFGADMDRVPVEVNRLNNQLLVQYYEQEWARWN